MALFDTFHVSKSAELPLSLGHQRKHAVTRVFAHPRENTAFVGHSRSKSTRKPAKSRVFGCGHARFTGFVGATGSRGDANSRKPHRRVTRRWGAGICTAGRQMPHCPRVWRVSGQGPETGRQTGNSWQPKAAKMPVWPRNLTFTRFRVNVQILRPPQQKQACFCCGGWPEND